MKRVFIDQDGVLADFDRFCKENKLEPGVAKKAPGTYKNLPVIPGAQQAVEDLLAWDFEVWIATKPPTGVAHAYSEKAEWIYKHFPKLSRNIIMTHDKGLLGDEGDFLIDDRVHKANCSNFKGTLIPFVDVTWMDVMVLFYKERNHGVV